MSDPHPGPALEAEGLGQTFKGGVRALDGLSFAVRPHRVYALYGLRGEQLRRRTAGLLDQFGLADAARRPAKTYSGGMRRRPDVAMVLVHRPAVLFLDEPPLRPAIG